MYRIICDWQRINILKIETVYVYTDTYDIYILYTYVHIYTKRKGYW